MQMVDWLIEQGKTSVKTSAGLGEHLIVYSKKFDEGGTFQNNTDNNLVTYAVDGKPLKVQAIVGAGDESAGCEFVGLYYTKQDANGNPVTVFLKKDGNVREEKGI